MSAGIRISKRKLGGLIVHELALLVVNSNSRNLNLDSIQDGSKSKPKTLEILSLEISIGSSAGSDFESTHSLISEAVPPQISSTNSVALSIACRVILKSTPLSKRREASV